LPQVLDTCRNLLQTLRVGMALSVVSNAWLVVFLARAIEPPAHRTAAIDRYALPYLLALTAVIALALHTFAVVLNDAMDVRRDRLFRGSQRHAAARPSGQRSWHTAVAVLCLLLAVSASVMLGTGSLVVVLLCAAAVLFYDTFGKYLPAVGIVSVALIRALILFVPNPRLGYAWPVLAVLTHTVICMAIGWRWIGKRPRLQGVELWLLCAGWGFWTLALIGWMTYHDTLRLPADVFPPMDDAGVWAPPIAAAVVLAIATARSRRIAQSDGNPARLREHGETFLRKAFTWLILYDAGWLLGLGMVKQAALHAVLFALAMALNHWTYAHPAAVGPSPRYRLSDVV